MLLTTSSKPVNTASYLFSGDYLDLAAAGAVLRDDELLIDLLLQLSDMGDDPDEAMPLGELRECLDRRMQRILVEGAEALIDEHGVEADAADARADLVAESEGEAEGSLEGLAARKRLH